MERPTLTKEKALQLARESWSKMERNRAYAATPDDFAWLGAIALAWYESGGSFGHPQAEGAETFCQFVAKIHAAAPEMRLMQPTPNEPTPTPKPWVDPVTGQALPPPGDLKSKTLLRQHDPELADHYDAMAANPYGHVLALREREAAHLRLKAIKYDLAEHTANPFVNGATMTQKNDFIRETSTDIVKFYRDETLPILLPSKNMAVRNRLVKLPRLDAIATRADQIVRGWNAEERERLRTEKAEAEKRLKALEAATT